MFIKVKVFPNSNKDEIIKKSEDSFHVKVRQKPVEGLANKSVIEILSRHFNIEKNKIFLIKGHRENKKIFEIKV